MNIGKIAVAVVVAAMSLTMTGCVTDTGANAFKYEYNSELGGMIVTDYLKESPKVSIPDDFEGYPVVGVDFKGVEKELTQVVMPDSVKVFELSDRIKSALQYINIPDSVSEIGYSAFNGCTGLTSVTIPDRVTEIGGSAFNGCTGLTSIVIPDSVSKIGYSAFNGCTGLTSVTIPDRVTEIGGSAFNGCTGLTSITIPDNIKEIGKNAFYRCNNIQITYQNKKYSYEDLEKLYIEINGQSLVPNQNEVTVPNFIGMTEEQIQKEYGEKFNLKFIYENSSAEKDQAIYQSVGSGTTIKSTQQISITISLGVKMEEIDEFKSRPKEEAFARLDNQGFEIEIINVYNETIPQNYVVKTEPAAHERAPVGSTVKVFVSNGRSPTLTSVPDFTNCYLANAQEIADRNDIVLLIEYIPYPADKPVDKGKVIRQSIEPNEKVDRKTVVTIYISNGEAEVKEGEYEIKLNISSDVTGEFVFKYYINGFLQADLTETRDISLTDKIVWSVKGSGTKSYSIVVENPNTSQRKTLLELKLNFDEDPVKVEEQTINEHVFSELSM